VESLTRQFLVLATIAMSPPSKNGQSPDHDEGSFSYDSRISTAEQLAYWAQMTPDNDGMLGGYPQVSRVDVQFSLNFIRKLLRTHPLGREKSKHAFRTCLETGAGIGRVTRNLLAPLCERIDVIEPMEKFTAVLTAEDSSLVKSGQLRRVWNVPLQEWTAESVPAYEVLTGSESSGLTGGAEGEGEKYDLIYNQWCLNHLSARDLVAYFREIIPLLAPQGWILVKENISSAPAGEDMFWEEDSSVTRSDANFRACFEEAGLVVVRTQLQTGFPKVLLSVRMYALRPVAEA
jgi:protein N-terminal methyltransferase